MTFTQILILFTSSFLIVDTLYSIYNFQYSYFLEIKRRFANLEEIPSTYKVKLVKEINDEVGFFRRLIQSSYIPWFIIVLFSKLFFLLIILSFAIVITNSIYKKGYISPIILLLNLILSLTIYLFVPINMFLNLI